LNDNSVKGRELRDFCPTARKGERERKEKEKGARKWVTSFKGGIKKEFSLMIWNARGTISIFAQDFSRHSIGSESRMGLTQVYRLVVRINDQSGMTHKIPDSLAQKTAKKSAVFFGRGVPAHPLPSHPRTSLGSVSLVFKYDLLGTAGKV